MLDQLLDAPWNVWLGAVLFATMIVMLDAWSRAAGLDGNGRWDEYDNSRFDDRDGA